MAATGRYRVPPTAALAISIGLIFVPLAFSEELLEPYYYLSGERWAAPGGILLLVDTALLSLAFGFAWWGSSGPAAGTLRPLWYAVGAAAHLLLDVIAVATRPTIATDLALAVLYVATLAILGAAVTGAAWLPARPRSGTTYAVVGRFGLVAPLVIGTFFAYLAETMYWYALGADPTTGRRAVNDEFFAQTSAVIPLLLIAIGFEARYFHRYARNLIGRATTTVIVAFLCFAELLVLTVLSVGAPGSAASTRDVTFAAYLEYAAFLLSLEACCMGLAMLAGALASVPASPVGTAEESPIGTAEQLPAARPPQV